MNNSKMLTKPWVVITDTGADGNWDMSDFPSLKEALKHFEAVKKDNKRYGFTTILAFLVMEE